jgi:hypothetical protein
MLAACLLEMGSGAGAQVANRAATQVVTPAPTVPPGADVVVVPPATPVAPPAAAVPVDPATEMKARYVGEIPPIELTLVYPPAEGQLFALETHNLVKREDGYYAPTEAANSFLMKIPEPWKYLPVTVVCAVKGKPRAVGSLFWQYSNDGTGGGVDFRFPPGETETRYQTNFQGGGYGFPMKSMWLNLPMATGVKECRISGTFVRSAN